MSQFKIVIEVERVEFDSEQCSLRINGKNCEENEHIKMGQYHTIDLETNFPFTLTKTFWDEQFITVLRESCNPAKRAEIAVVTMQEGLANLCLIKSALTITKNGQNKEKAVDKFYDDIYGAIKMHVNFDTVKVVLVGSPGFLNEEFMTYMLAQATRLSDAAVLRHKGKFVLAHCSCGYRSAVEEMLTDSATLGLLADVKAADEVRALERFHVCLSADTDKACYGFQQVLLADEHMAVAELLITDSLFRAADVATRNRYSALTDSVKLHGGKVYQFSAGHVSGAQLQLYTGVAAILRFPMDEQVFEQQQTSPTAGGILPNDSHARSAYEMFDDENEEDIACYENYLHNELDDSEDDNEDDKGAASHTFDESDLCC